MIAIAIRFKAKFGSLPGGYAYVVDSEGHYVVDSLGRYVIAQI